MVSALGRPQIGARRFLIKICKWKILFMV